GRHRRYIRVASDDCARDLKGGKGRLQVGFETAVVEALPFPEARFDAVLGTVMLHHLPRKVRQQCVSEIRCVLKPEGVCSLAKFAQGPDRRSFHSRFHVTGMSIRVRLCRCSRMPACARSTAARSASAAFITSMAAATGSP